MSLRESRVRSGRALPARSDDRSVIQAVCSGNVYLRHGFGSEWPKFPWPKFPRPVFSRPTRSRCPRSRCSRGRHSRVRSVIPSDRFESTWLEWPNFAADVSRARPIFRGRYFAHFQYSRPVFCGRYFVADIPLPRRIFAAGFPSADISAADLFLAYGSAMDDSRFTTGPRRRCSRAGPYSLPCALEVFFLG